MVASYGVLSCAPIEKSTEQDAAAVVEKEPELGSVTKPSPPEIRSGVCFKSWLKEFESISISPSELEHLCKESYLSWQSLGKATYKKQKSEEKNIIFKRSIYFVRDLPKGHIITTEDIKRIRPGMGLPPKLFDQIIGKKTTQSVERGQATSLDLIEDL